MLPPDGCAYAIMKKTICKEVFMTLRDFGWVPMYTDEAVDKAQWQRDHEKAVADYLANGGTIYYAKPGESGIKELTEEELKALPKRARYAYYAKRRAYLDWWQESVAEDDAEETDTAPEVQEITGKEVVNGD